MYGDEGTPGKARKEFDVKTKEAMLNQDVHSHLGPNDDEFDYVYNWNTKKTEKIKIPAKTPSKIEKLNFMDMVDANGTPIDYFDPKWDRLVENLGEGEMYAFLSFGKCPHTPEKSF